MAGGIFIPIFTQKGGERMIVKVTRTFRDREANLVTRKVGETYETGKERAVQLRVLGFVEIVPEKHQKGGDPVSPEDAQG